MTHVRSFLRYQDFNSFIAGKLFCNFRMPFQINLQFFRYDFFLGNNFYFFIRNLPDFFFQYGALPQKPCSLFFASAKEKRGKERHFTPHTALRNVASPPASPRFILGGLGGVRSYRPRAAMRRWVDRLNNKNTLLFGRIFLVEIQRSLSNSRLASYSPWKTTRRPTRDCANWLPGNPPSPPLLLPYNGVK